MKRKSLLGVAAGGAAAVGLELFNRSVRLPKGAVKPSLPGARTTWDWRYGELAVYRAGDTAAPPIVLLHGHNAAASAYEMRFPFSLLAEQFHVFAPDLLGYGASNRPAIEYTPQLYMDLIEDLLREVVQGPAAIVASSLTSSYAIEVAARSPEWVSALVLLCPTGVRVLDKQPFYGPALNSLFRSPVLGEALFNGLASRASIAYYLKKQSYYDAGNVTDDMIEMYYNTAHGPGARYAPAAFVSGKLYWDASDAWTRLQTPVLVIWGREAHFTPIEDAAAFLATNPAAELQVIPRAGILPHDEQPEQVVNAITAFLERSSET